MSSAATNSDSNKRLGFAWLILTVALAFHILDEALTGFLAVYNPTVLAMRAKYSWFPMPTFDFNTWLTGLVGAVLIMLALSPLFFRNVGWLRPLAYFGAVVNFLNALGHTLGTIMGRTVASVHFARPAPGFWSSPLLFAASLYLLFALARSRPNRARAKTANAG